MKLPSLTLALAVCAIAIVASFQVERFAGELTLRQLSILLLCQLASLATFGVLAVIKVVQLLPKIDASKLGPKNG